MAIKIIQIYPDRSVGKDNKILRQKAKEVAQKEIGSKKIKDILGWMEEILAESKEGVALAAPQIGEPLQIFIVKLIPDAGFKIFINPKIKKISQKKQIVPEGCLSVEGVYGAIKRAEKLTVEAYDEKGKKFTCGASGLLAQIIQHEMDHLNGILFVDKAIKLEKITGN
jgi:peptide deformylase